ncbi:27 kDa glycoprotein-like isoform X2 [Trichoplusia ni]|uniref:27 kDa glycoprotein-like isoform X2 n=1 Tax=Trichoplusia ni TaxID=7111 RepID=A0A7E5WHN9_TRINI|nr:27 kDa glycoprotein-like isoform X2 [Trichoplusia ni]
MAPLFLIFAVFISATLGQTIDEGIFNKPVSVPPELQDKISNEEVEKLKTKYMDEFKRKCEQNGHPELYETAQTSVVELMNCFNSLVNMEVLQNEIEEAKPNGQVDEVFKKYCNKSPQFKGCFRNMTETVKPCFSTDEQKNFKTLYNVTEQLADFICYKDGDRIALFIAEGGKECFQDQQEGIQGCFNSTFDAETQGSLQNISSVEGFMELEFKEKQCNQMSTLQSCVVSVLEQCVKPTSANIVESLFNFIRKATPCKNFAKEEAKPATGAANGLTITSATLITAFLAAILA